MYLMPVALLLHPEEMWKCQAEIDDITGHRRLPEFSDESRLPYLRAVIKESQRSESKCPLISN